MRTFDKSKTYVVAVSFGPDSMALLNMLLDQNLSLVVCHVNYKKRKEADDEEKGLIEFCRINNVKLHILHAPKPPIHVNFQAWARDLRYRFFKEIYQKYQADALFVAHHLDDDLETYFLQKKKLLVHYGIKEERELYSMKVIRPLLSYRKKNLKQYCIDNNIPFGTDVSNESDDYERNKIRHRIIERSTDEEIMEILKEKETLNELRSEQMKKIQEVYKDNLILVSKFNQLSEDEKMLCLHEYISRYIGDYNLSKYKAMMMIQASLSKKPNWKMLLTPPYQIIKAYNTLYVGYVNGVKPYEYILEKPGVLDTPYFYLDFTSGAENRNVFDYDYPLTIRNARNGDTLSVEGGRKTIQRMFLDWKMPTELRHKWPLIVNNKGQIIYVPRYKENFVDDGTYNLVVKSKLGI